jgi:hypothetical protein
MKSIDRSIPAGKKGNQRSTALSVTDSTVKHYLLLTELTKPKKIRIENERTISQELTAGWNRFVEAPVYSPTNHFSSF